MNFILSFFVILVWNVSISRCLSKREFRDCQKFFEDRRSSDWSTRKRGFFFFFFSLVWDFFDDLLKSTFCETKRERQLCLRQLREVILTLLLYWWKEVLQSILEIMSVFFFFFFFLFWMSCLFLYVGGEEEEFMNSILSFCHFRVECLHFTLLVKKGI